MAKTLSQPENLFVPGNISFEAFDKISAINTRTLTKLTEVQFNLASLGLQTTVEQARLLSDAGNYEDLYSVESSLASDYGNKLFEISRETTGIFIESGDEFAAVVGKIFDQAKDDMPKAKKPAVSAARAPATKKAARAKPAAKKKKAVKKSA